MIFFDLFIYLFIFLIFFLKFDYTFEMPRKTKRQQQVSQIPRKKGRYVSQDQLIIERDTSESEIIELIDDFVDDWTEEDLKEFKDVEKKLITETLHWHEDANHSIRAVYTGNSRTTT